LGNLPEYRNSQSAWQGISKNISKQVNTGFLQNVLVDLGTISRLSESHTNVRHEARAGPPSKAEQKSRLLDFRINSLKLFLFLSKM
jgi:hypothetical protein